MKILQVGIMEREKFQVKKYRKIFTTGATLTRFNEVPYYDEGLYEVAKNTYAWTVVHESDSLCTSWH